MPDPHYRALLIANGTFDRDPHKLSVLKGPANDVQLMRAALTHPDFGLFDPANVRHLLDATNAEVLEAVEVFFNDAGPEDHLLFYYSGHGYPDTNNNLYLCARNTRTNLLTSSAVSDRAINSMAENSRARKFIFILDCCHSGGFKGGAEALQLGRGSGRCLITSCASDQLSADAGNTGGASTFTFFLTKALTSGEVDADGDGVVDTSEVFKFVQPRVYDATRQTVQWTMDKTFGEAAIARAVPRARPEAKVEAKPRETRAPIPGRPVLELSESRIEARDVQPGEPLPLERIDVYNAGEGNLDWTHECPDPWIGIERKGDSLFVKLDTAQPGTRRGNIFVRDRGRGGARTVRVLLQVVAPEVPQLVVSPNRLDFGSCTREDVPVLKVRVSNAGPGRLQWEVESAPDGVVVTRQGDTGFTVELAAGFVGDLSGLLRVKSNGGVAELTVTASVMPPLLSSAAPAAGPGHAGPANPALNPFVTALPGWWMNNAGALLIKLEGGALFYTDHNLVGLKVGQGTIQVQGNTALLQGTNNFVGAYSAQVSIQGGALTGILQTATGQGGPIMFARQQPWFAALW